MPWFSRNDTAWLSRSENSATSTLAPVTSLRPDDCTWTAARWTTRWKPAVGSGSLGFWVMMPFRRLSMKVSRSWRRRSMSTPQALRTGTASSSSVIASSRCSRVAYSCRRSPASPKARWRDFSRFLDSMDIELPRLKEQRTTLAEFTPSPTCTGEDAGSCARNPPFASPWSRRSRRCKRRTHPRPSDGHAA